MGAAALPLWPVTTPPVQVSPRRKLTVSPGLRTVALIFASDFQGVELEVPELLSLPAALMKYVVPAAAWAGDGSPAVDPTARRVATTVALRAWTETRFWLIRRI